MLIMQTDIVDIVERTSKFNDMTTQGIMLLVIVFLVYAIVQLKKEIKSKENDLKEAHKDQLKAEKEKTELIIQINKEYNAYAQETVRVIDEIKSLYNGKAG